MIPKWRSSLKLLFLLQAAFAILILFVSSSTTRSIVIADMHVTLSAGVCSDDDWQLEAYLHETLMATATGNAANARPSVVIHELRFTKRESLFRSKFYADLSSYRFKLTCGERSVDMVGKATMLRRAVAANDKHYECVLEEDPLRNNLKRNSN